MTKQRQTDNGCCTKLSVLCHHTHICKNNTSSAWKRCCLWFLDKVQVKVARLFYPYSNKWEGSWSYLVGVSCLCCAVLLFAAYLLERKTMSPTHFYQLTGLRVYRWGVQAVDNDEWFYFCVGGWNSTGVKNNISLSKNVWVFEKKMKVCVVSSSGEVFTWWRLCQCVCVYLPLY